MGSPFFTCPCSACKSGLQMACNLDQSAMAAGRMEKPARFSEGGSVFSDPLAVDHAAFASRYEPQQVGTPFFKATPLFRRPCTVDLQCYGGCRTEKPARFWRGERVL